MATTEQVIIQYEADIKQLKSDLKTVQNELTSVGKTAEQSSKKVKKGFGGLSPTFGALAGVIGAAFTVHQVINFTKHIIQLSAEAQGVEQAFKRIDDGKLLGNLRKATRGTVDDLTLMKQAIRADNFKIPMDLLAQGLELARRRAKETGESVESLVHSFENGVGRKSAYVLQNLGLSIEEIQEETKKTGSFTEAVGIVMERAYEGVGDEVLTTIEKQEQLAATLRNQSKILGDEVLPLWDKFLLATITGVNKLLGGINEKSAQVIFMSDLREATQLWGTATTDAFETNRKGLVESSDGFNALSTGIREATDEEIKLVNQLRQLRDGDYFDPLLENIEEYTKAHKNTLPQDSIRALREELKDAQEAYETTTRGSADFVLAQSEVERITNALSNALKTNADRLAETKKAAEEAEEEFEKLKKSVMSGAFSIDRSEIDFDEVQQAYSEAWTKIANDFVSIMSDGTKTLADGISEDMELVSKKVKEVVIAGDDDETVDELGKIAQAYQTTGEVIGSFGQLVSATGILLGAEGEKAAKFQHAAAIFQLAANTATAISGAVAAANENPLNGITFGAAGIAQLAVSLASIIANMANAKKSLGSAQQPKYAKGVIDLSGPGTGTSDSIPAFLSAGESVMTAKQTKKHKDLLYAIKNDSVDKFFQSKYDDTELRNTIKFGYKKADKNTNRLIRALNKSQYVANW